MGKPVAGESIGHEFLPPVVIHNILTWRHRQVKLKLNMMGKLMRVYEVRSCRFKSSVIQELEHSIAQNDRVFIESLPACRCGHCVHRQKWVVEALRYLLYHLMDIVGKVYHTADVVEFEHPLYDRHNLAVILKIFPVHAKQKYIFLQYATLQISISPELHLFAVSPLQLQSLARIVEKLFARLLVYIMFVYVRHA